MESIVKHSVRFIVALFFLTVVPLASFAGLEGEWGVRVNEVIKKASPDDPDKLKTKIVFKYRYHDALPEERFLFAVATPPQFVPQTIKQYSDRVYAFNLAQANVYEVCPHQFELIEENGETIGPGLLTLKANIDFDPRRTPGLPFQQVILHDWGNIYEGLGGVSQFNFVTSLETMVLSAGLMMCRGRFEDATIEECIEIVSESIRQLQPTEDELARGVLVDRPSFRVPSPTRLNSSF